MIRLEIIAQGLPHLANGRPTCMNLGCGIVNDRDRSKTVSATLVLHLTLFEQTVVVWPIAMTDAIKLPILLQPMVFGKPVYVYVEQESESGS